MPRNEQDGTTASKDALQAREAACGLISTGFADQIKKHLGPKAPQAVPPVSFVTGNPNKAALFRANNFGVMSLEGPSHEAHVWGRDVDAFDFGIAGGDWGNMQGHVPDPRAMDPSLLLVASPAGKAVQTKIGQALRTNIARDRWLGANDTTGVVVRTYKPNLTMLTDVLNIEAPWQARSQQILRMMDDPHKTTHLGFHNVTSVCVGEHEYDTLTLSFSVLFERTEKFFDRVRKALHDGDPKLPVGFDLGDPELSDHIHRIDAVAYAAPWHYGYTTLSFDSTVQPSQVNTLVLDLAHGPSDLVLRTMSKVLERLREGV